MRAFLKMALIFASIVPAAAQADYQEGTTAYLAGDYARALEEFRAGAETGDPRAQYNLGAMYHHGLGVGQDYGKAALWYLRAARKDFPLAQGNLGVLHEDGLGLPQDYELAAHWYRKAAMQGDGAAQANLGRLYAKGLGVAVDLVQAYKWTFLAEKHVSEDSERAKMAERLNWLAEQMTDRQIAEAERQVRAWRAAHP